MMQAPPLSQVALLRMEAGRAAPNEQEARIQLNWDVTLDMSIDDTALFTGHLFRTSQNAFGQSLAIGAVKLNGNHMAFDEIVEWGKASGLVESLYDACRRSLDAQASLMDIAFDLPTKAPDVDIERDDDEGSPE